MSNDIIILDVCGTLYHSNTTMDFCKFSTRSRLKKLFLYSLTSIPGKVLNKISMKFFKFDFIRSAHIYALKGIDRKQLNELAIEFVNDFLAYRKIQEVHNLIAHLKDKEIIIVSASIDPVIEVVANMLGIEKYISSTMRYENGICKGCIQTDLLGEKHKYFLDKKVDLVITDNKSDLKLCRLADEVIIVTKYKNIAFWKKQNLNISQLIKV